MKKCPKCGSRRIAPILYGMTVFNEEMKRQLDNEELYLGGCCISGYDPQFHCFECDSDVGSSPILFSEKGEEDYRSIVTAIHFSDGGYFGGYQELDIVKEDGKIVLEASPDMNEPEKGLKRKMSEKEWAKLLDRLYCRLFIHEWEKEYIDPHVLDGEQWSLEIKLTGGREIEYYGSNAFPPYWKELKSAFRPLFKEAGISF